MCVGVGGDVGVDVGVDCARHDSKRNIHFLPYYEMRIEWTLESCLDVQNNTKKGNVVMSPRSFHRIFNVKHL